MFLVTAWHTYTETLYTSGSICSQSEWQWCPWCWTDTWGHRIWVVIAKADSVFSTRWFHNFKYSLLLIFVNNVTGCKLLAPRSNSSRQISRKFQPEIMHTGKDPLPPPSALPSLRSAWRSNSELRIPGEGHDSQVGVQLAFYMLLHRLEVCARTNLSFESCDTVGNQLWLKHPPLQPGLPQQKRDEITWGGSVRVALGEWDRLVGVPLVTTPEDCIHTSHVWWCIQGPFCWLLHPQVKFLQADLMKVSTRNNAHWERPFASTISSAKSTQCLEIQLRAENTCGGGRRERREGQLVLAYL